MFKSLLQVLRKKYQSLIFRILLYFALSALTIAIVLGWNFANRIKPHFENEILPNLSQYIQYLVLDVGTPPDLEKARRLTASLPFELRIEGHGVNWSSNALLRSVDQYHFKTAPNPYQQYQITRRKGEHLLLLEKQGYRYLFAVESSFRSSFRSRHWLLFTLLAGILILLYLGIRRLFNPLSDISAHLKKIGSGQLDETINVGGKGELVELAEGINRMSNDIKSMLESKAGMLLAISHELRSPITRMRINLELIEATEARQTLISDLQEMEELISAILESEKLSNRHAILSRSKFDLAVSIDSIIDQYFPECDINKDLSPMVVTLDEVRIRLLVKNLLDNACRYSESSGKAVQIALTQAGRQIKLAVADQGPGVGADDLAHITEPFYRTDGARLRKTGGYGLGLYLCRLIAEAHDGELEIKSKLGEGMTVYLELPIAPD